MPVGVTPQGRHFPRPNRIIFGISRAVIVVEAAERFSSATTAHFAGELCKLIHVMPGLPLDARSNGTAKLICNGATTLLIFSEPALEALEGLFERCPPVSIFKNARVSAVNPSLLHTPILELLSHPPTLTDEITRHCDASASAVRAVLLTLELAGRIRRISANLAVFNEA